MADFVFDVVITRTLLGLANLDLNDHVNFYVAKDNMFGAAVQYNRNQITSPYMDGAVTVNRQKQAVQDQLTIEILPTANLALLATNIQSLIAAFTQDSYTLAVTMGSQTNTYNCEAADYTVSYEQSRFNARRASVTFQFIRQPNPASGVF